MKLYMQNDMQTHEIHVNIHKNINVELFFKQTTINSFSYIINNIKAPIIEHLSLIMIYTNWLLTWDVPPNRRHYCTKSFYNRPPPCWGYESTRMSKTLSTQFPLISHPIHSCNHPNHQLSFPLQSAQPREVDPLLCNAVPQAVTPLFLGSNIDWPGKYQCWDLQGCLVSIFTIVIQFIPLTSLAPFLLQFIPSNMKVERWNNG
jgi:hypothetical protein